VIATPIGDEPTVMSVGCLVPVFTSIVDTVPLFLLVTKAVLPFGVTAAPAASGPTVMSVGSLILVFHVDRRHRAAPLGDESGLAARRDRHPPRVNPVRNNESADCTDGAGCT